ncbi:cellulose-binding domain-containing protein [Cellulomonas soli]|uniref:CBM2 domain-containing protein n=1 Tax=Cellulomonas soli TaxID=931535 RepID=A0A512PI57_9CELL|nr:cellulose-binding domain-containing protein [Cellulomonas soli]NYI58745.1 hypothetical protein [Cellulomonas soli]GEP70875.1 hypothetical protein CSO01_35900 [Cellulomonas soli]
MHDRRPRFTWRRRALVAAVSVAVAVGGLTVAAVAATSTRTGCVVDFAVDSRWSSGYTGDATITNTGERVDDWVLTWTFVSGEQITQGWNGSFTAAGADVTWTHPSWAPSLAAGATTSFGFLATHTGTITPPTAVRLNGVACTATGAPAPTATATGTATASPKPTATPTVAPTAAPTATPTATPGPTATPTSTPTSSPAPTAAPAAWDPPAALVSPLAEVWAHQESTYSDLYGFRNYGWDQVVANGGYLNVCVRWDSDQPVSAELRDRIQAKYAEQYQKWFAALQQDGTGWNGWPYPTVQVKVVGWAVRDRSLLQWTDDSVDVYVGDIREDAPQCPEDLGRFFHQDAQYPGGVARHYDQSLWLTSGMEGGAGGDWGQRMGSEYFVGALDSPDVTILLHEIGHTFGLDDFYDWTPTGQTSFIMQAGSSQSITPFDTWMLRDWWRHLRSRYGL